jgi:hypothetical protein
MVRTTAEAVWWSPKTWQAHASQEEAGEMTDVDITADLNAEDQTGYVWTFLAYRVVPGKG